MEKEKNYLTLYTSTSCSSCRKVKKWLNEKKINYVEKNLLMNKLTINELKKILIYTENGFDDIISSRSKFIKKNDQKIEHMPVDDVLNLIIKNPSILKRPIVIHEAKQQVLVGYNNEEIELLLRND